MHCSVGAKYLMQCNLHMGDQEHPVFAIPQPAAMAKVGVWDFPYYCHTGQLHELLNIQIYVYINVYSTNRPEWNTHTQANLQIKLHACHTHAVCVEAPRMRFSEILFIKAGHKYGL